MLHSVTAMVITVGLYETTGYVHCTIDK